MNERGFIEVDAQQRTGEKNIFAVGDAMLAHKGMYEGKVTAEVIAGKPSAFDVRSIPAVVFTDPQIAWCGLTETEARERGWKVEVARFPWSASGRAASMGLSAGLTTIVIDTETRRILGVGIVGREAGEMIGEGVLAVEMGALVEDLALSMHPPSDPLGGGTGSRGSLSRERDPHLRRKEKGEVTRAGVPESLKIIPFSCDSRAPRQAGIIFQKFLRVTPSLLHREPAHGCRPVPRTRP